MFGHLFDKLVLTLFALQFSNLVLQQGYVLFRGLFLLVFDLREGGKLFS